MSNELKDIDKDFLENLYKNDNFFLVLGSLISADNLISADECKNALAILSNFKKILPTTNIPEKEWKDFIDKGISICKRDLYHFLDADNDEYNYGHNV